MTKEIILSALDAFTPGFLAQKMWSHPSDRSREMQKIAYWTEYARLLERGLFDMIFIADTIGVYDVYGGSKDPAVRNAVQVPIYDPFALVSGMAAVTEHLCFGVTGNALFEPPYLFARRLSTLGHLTSGRIGWNIVTGILESGAKAQGRAPLGHDERYDFADEFMEIVLRLWETSWEDDAVLDANADAYADPAKVHAIAFEGKHLTMSGMHLSDPSPQRTPLLFQAGASHRGKQFASHYAECLFVNGTSRRSVAGTVAGIREGMRAEGRGPDEVRILAGLTVIVGRTEAEAQAKYASLLKASDAEAALVHVSGGLGIDLSRYPLDRQIEYSETDANRTLMQNLTRNGDRTYTVRQVGEEMMLSGRNALIVGSPDQVADEMIRWMDETDIDGFNLARLLMPESFEDFIDLVVPVLQERGVYKRRYRAGTLREKLGLGDGPRLLPSHPGRKLAHSRAA